MPHATPKPRSPVAAADGRTSLIDAAPQALPLLLGLSVFVLLLAKAGALLNDPDTYWHIGLGRWIIENGAVPSTDPFSHSMAGAPWHAHEWASGLMLAAADALAGWPGVAALAAFAVALSAGILAWGLSRHLRGFYVVAITALAIMGMSEHILARPHALVLPVLVLWTVLLVRARSEGRRPPLAAALLMVPWANMHGSFPIGLAVAGLLAAEALLEATDRAGRMRAVRDWGAFGLLATLGALVTPYGIQGFLFPFQIGGMEKSFAWITEWHPPDFGAWPPVEIWLLVVLAVLLARGLRLPPMRLVICVGLLHLALSHVRMAEYVILIGSLLAAPLIARQWADAPAAPSPEPLSRTFRLGLALGGGLAAAAAISLLAVGGLAPDAGKSPAAALAAARQAGLTQRPVFNDYDFGGYLIYEGVPTFIDGRADMYGDDFVDRTMTAATDPLAEPGLQQLLEEHHVGWTLLSADSVAVQLLDRDPRWREFYRDGIAVIHVPAGGQGS